MYLFLWACTAPLCVQAQSASLDANVQVRNLALYQETLDLCMKSMDYRSLPVKVDMEIAAISKKIDRIASQIHDAPNAKLLYVSYSVATYQLRQSVEFRKQRKSQPGGVCSYEGIKDIEAKLKVAEAAIRRKIAAR
jgi:hypothetical protein